MTKMEAPVVFLREPLQRATHSPQLVELSGHRHVLATVEPNNLGRKTHRLVTSDLRPPDRSAQSFTHSSRHPASVTTANVCRQIGEFGRSPDSTCWNSSNHGLLEGTCRVQPAESPLQQQQEVTTSRLTRWRCFHCCISQQSFYPILFKRACVVWFSEIYQRPSGSNLQAPEPVMAEGVDEHLVAKSPAVNYVNNCSSCSNMITIFGCLMEQFKPELKLRFLVLVD